MHSDRAVTPFIVPEMTSPPGGLNTRWADVLAASGDCILVSMSATLAFAVTDSIAAISKLHVAFAHTSEQFAFVLLYTTITLLICSSFGVYRRRQWPTMQKVGRLLVSVGAATTLVAAFIITASLPRWILIPVCSACLISSVLLSTKHVVSSAAFERRVKTGVAGQNVLLVGCSRAARQLANALEKNPEWGYRFVGFIVDEPVRESRVLGSTVDITSVVQAHFIDEIIITPPYVDRTCAMLADALAQRITLRIIPDIFSPINVPSVWQYLGDIPTLTVSRREIPAVAMFFKRVFDVIVSATALAACLPLLVLVAIAIKLDSRGPVLYNSTRVGRRARHFKFYKFRTMCVGADTRRAELVHLNKREGPFFKIENDPRVTRVGRILRKYSLDELPQLWNVLIGDMSLVGPRPHPVADYNQYQLEHLCRLNVLPGITGLWQVTARKDPSWEKNISLDVEYIENWCWRLDFKILLKTLPAVISGGGE